MPMTTSNLNLNKTDTTSDGGGSFVDKNEFFNFDTDLNDNWDIIDNAIGKPSNLTTVEKSNLVGAINELKSDIGNTSGLANTDLSNLSAIGEAHFVKSNIAVTHTANNSVGSSTNPVYVNSSGVATACGFTWSTIHAVITKYNSGTSWYRVWSDGWIEQGGLTAESTDKIHTVSFLKPFSNTYYTAMCCVCDTTAAAVKTWYDTQIVTKAKANMTIGNNNATSRKISWYACGY